MFEVARKYYAVISALNDLGLTEKELLLVSYSAVHGSVGNQEVRDAFCSEHGSTPATVNNMVSRLRKRGVMVKRNGKVWVAPAIALDFSRNVKMEVSLVHGDVEG